MSGLPSRVACCFMHQDAATASKFWNRAAACWTGSDVVHCEFYFCAHQTTCSVDSRNPVGFRGPPPKDYSWRAARTWETIVLGTEVQQYDAVLEFCVRQCGKPFDGAGRVCMLLASLIIRPPSDDDDGSGSWTCARLMATALVRAAVLSSDADTRSVTPSSLRAMLTSALCRVSTF